MQNQDMSTGHMAAKEGHHHDRLHRVEKDLIEIPRIALDMWKHKTVIAIHWTVLFISSCVIPIVFYFTLRYAANLKLSDVLAITTSIFGAVTLFSLLKRFWSLLRKESNCRPLGASRSAMDYFQWNFLFGFASVTAIVVAGNVTLNIRVVALGLPLLLFDVCLQLLLVGIMASMRINAPFRISSVAKGEPVRSGVYAIAEDIVAVDGNQGESYRRQLESRYLASKPIQELCTRLDLFWGITGIAVSGMTIGLLFGLKNENVAYVIGWAVPWAYAGIMAILTIRMVSHTVHNTEEAHFSMKGMQV